MAFLCIETFSWSNGGNVMIQSPDQTNSQQKNSKTDVK